MISSSFQCIYSVRLFLFPVHMKLNIIFCNYLNVQQKLLLAPADVLQLLLLLWSEVIWHWKENRRKDETTPTLTCKHIYP